MFLSCHVRVSEWIHTQCSLTYSCLNVKKLLAQSRHEIWRLSDCNWTRTQNHLVLKQTLNHLAKWFWVRAQLQKLSCLFQRENKFDWRTAIDPRGEKTINNDSECEIATWCNNRSEKARHIKKLYNTAGLENQNPNWHKS